MKIYKYLIISCLMLISSCSSGGSDDTPTSTEDTSAPTVPTNLTGVSASSTSIDLSWAASTDNVGVKNYGIYIDNQAFTTTTATSYTVRALASSTTYAFKVKAIDAAENESGFSNVVTVTTDDDAPVMISTSGNLETYLGTVIDNIPGSSVNNYKVPLTVELITWNEIIDAILAEDISEAVLKSDELNYQIKEFTDTTLTPNQVFYILEENGERSNYWGTYVFSKTPTISNLILQAPHIINDTNTGKQAVYCFINNVAKALFISGAHRCNSASYSSCSGTTEACNSSSEAFRVSDLAHNTSSAFQKTTENIFNTISNSVFIQLHGFSKEDTDPYVIMSNGTRVTPTTDYATLLKDALLIEDSSLTFKIAHIDTDWTRLIGFTNTQGRLINNVADPCSASATATMGRFIHIEQERTKLRESTTEWSKMSNALQSVFK